LDYAHGQGVIHRDVKPANVIIGEGDRLKLLDFGLAHIFDETRLTLSGSVGTPAYRAPEAYQSSSADRSVDLYALGVMAYEMLTGQLPFREEDEARLMYAHLSKSPPSPRSIVPELPLTVERALLKQLAKEPTKRFPTARDFVAALDLLTERPSPAEFASKVSEEPSPRAAMAAVSRDMVTREFGLMSEQRQDASLLDAIGDLCREMRTEPVAELTLKERLPSTTFEQLLPSLERLVRARLIERVANRRQPSQAKLTVKGFELYAVSRFLIDEMQDSVLLSLVDYGLHSVVELIASLSYGKWEIEKLVEKLGVAGYVNVKPFVGGNRLTPTEKGRQHAAELHAAGWGPGGR
jgi:serine/threonine protein kinase